MLMMKANLSTKLLKNPLKPFKLYDLQLKEPFNTSVNQH